MQKRLVKLNSVSSQCEQGKSSIARKPEVHPKNFNWYKTFHKCNPPDFKLYTGNLKLTNKTIPIWCNVNFSSLFGVLFNVVKTDTKLTLYHMGKIIIIKLTNIKFKIWRVTFFH